MMTTPSNTCTKASNTNDAREPSGKYWCSVCCLDLRSAMNLARHMNGRKHFQRCRAAQAGTERILYRCDLCNRNFDSLLARDDHEGAKKHSRRWAKLAQQIADLGEAGPSLVRTPPSVPHNTRSTTHLDMSDLSDDGHFQRQAAIPRSSQSFHCRLCKQWFGTYDEKKGHDEFDLAHLRRVYEKKQIFNIDQDAADEVCFQLELAKHAEKRGEDVDYSKVHDVGRMIQRAYDDSVVELALHQYERFHGMEHGTATYEEVNGSSAGINGWAACSIDDVKPGAGGMKDTVKPGTQESKPSAVKSIDTVTTSRHKGDEQEREMMRMALMKPLLEPTVKVELLNSNPQDNMPADDDDDDDDDNSSYEYEDEEEGDTEGNNIQDSVVSVTSVKLDDDTIEDGSMCSDGCSSGEHLSQMSGQDNLSDSPVMVHRDDDLSSSSDDRSEGSWSIIDG